MTPVYRDVKWFPLASFGVVKWTHLSQSLGQWKRRGSLQCRQILSFVGWGGEQGSIGWGKFQVRSNSRGATGFVGQRQRLCVLLTRARRELKEFPLGCWWWGWKVMKFYKFFIMCHVFSVKAGAELRLQYLLVWLVWCLVLGRVM